MIEIKSILVKNFMSVGNASQCVIFDRNDLTLVLGQNMDLGGDDTGSRNGTGKCMTASTSVSVKNSIGKVFDTTLGDIFDEFYKDDHYDDRRIELSDEDQKKFTISLRIDNLLIDTDTGWHPITAIHETIPFRVWNIMTDSGKELDCADTHILFDHIGKKIFAKDLVPGVTKIMTRDGDELVISADEGEHSETMYDITVNSNDHRFYSNDILSHNTTIINALSYVLFGQALTNIKRDNLINKTNGKNMLVTLDFNINDVKYRIERGRKPNILKFFVNGVNTANAVEQDDSQGDSRETQGDIIKALNLTHDMFKHVVALNTYSEPFLALRVSDQRTIIEQLLGVTVLSEKAALLKESIKTTKDEISYEEMRISTQTEANNRIGTQITALKTKQRTWILKKNTDLRDLTNALEELLKIDIDAEIQNHKDNAAKAEATTKRKNILKLVDLTKSNISRGDSQALKLKSEIEDLKNHKCYACGSDIHDANQKEILDKKEKHLGEVLSDLRKDRAQLDSYQRDLDLTNDIGAISSVFYKSLEEALNHKASIEQLGALIVSKENELDPFGDQIENMSKTAIVEIKWDRVNELTRQRDHKEFLLKLLVNKDSFVRKKIIDQNLNYLNQRLGSYIQSIGLPHAVVFKNDLSVEISELGRELDFDNLSRGERNRLILSLSWAFRDVWESLYSTINLLFIDELIDSGMDSSGVEQSVAVLKKMARDRKKSIFLVSHREELTSRVDNILTVTKENGFTQYSNDIEIVS